MKKLLLMVTALLIIGSPPSFSQQGKNCFNTQFHNDATTLDMNNAYLLGYLCTMSYAQYLRFLLGDPAPAEKSPAVDSLKAHDDHFLDVFRKELTPYFMNGLTLAPGAVQAVENAGINQNKAILLQKSTTPTEPTVTFDFVHQCNPAGYDPEALLISTPTTIYVVFRGTDRVACNVNSFQAEWAEWFTTDFNFFKREGTVINNSVQGQVHRGMVESLLYKGFADSLATEVSSLLKNKSTGVNKKVWITGHSLGGAHAQLFAMFLKFNYNITAQGLYLYESPHPGDATFVNQLNNVLGKTHIQRFEFGDDPIPTLPPQVFFFARAGVRNFFNDYNTPAITTEQIPGIDDMKILCALGNLAPEQIPQTAHFQFPPYCPGSTCFHHPTLILQAIRHAMNSSTLSSFPIAVPLPLAGNNCTSGDLTKAANNDVINNTVTAGVNIIVNIAWEVGNLASNFLGTGLAEGKYKIACYGFQNNTKKYLNWNGSVNSQLSISTSGSVFNVVHKSIGGYQLFIGGGNMAADVNFNLVGLPDGTQKTNNIIMKTKDGTIGDEETWYFYNIPNKPNTYAILNWNTQWVMEANSSCLSNNACDVNEAKASDNNATQVWILEKVNQ